MQTLLWLLLSGVAVTSQNLIVSPQTLQYQATATVAAQRLDTIIRSDFFIGLTGDAAALGRAMDACETILRTQPNHGEALVWHGSGLLYLAGQAFQKNDFKQGMAIWDEGLREMNRAVAEHPDDIGVLIPRAATFAEMSRYIVDRSISSGLLATAVADYQKVLALQEPYLATIPVHSRGELLLGLADVLDRSGDQANSQKYLRRAIAECRGSEYERRASQWLNNDRTKQLTCLGCHK